MFEQKDVLTLQAANARLDAIEVRRAQFAAASAKNASDLMDAEARLGEAVIDGDNTVGALVASLRIQVDGFAAAFLVLEKRREVAQRDCRRAQAVDFRRRAARLRDELGELEGKTAKVLTELSKLENVQFDACILAAQRIGNWLPRASTNVEPWQSSLECGSDPCNTTPFATPKSRRLRNEADDLERQARDIEQELLRAAYQAPATTPAAPDTPATGPCFCEACKRARQTVSSNEWAAGVEAGANAGA
jgi:hypothetical protein